VSDDRVRRDAGGYWLIEKARAESARHRCEFPAPDDRTALGSVWECSSCQMTWTLRQVLPPSDNPFPRLPTSDGAEANNPWMRGPDGSRWVAFGRRNRRIARRLGMVKR
jgi:hypothetical protein